MLIITSNPPKCENLPSSSPIFIFDLLKSDPAANKFQLMQDALNPHFVTPFPLIFQVEFFIISKIDVIFGKKLNNL